MEEQLDSFLTDWDINPNKYIIGSMNAVILALYDERAEKLSGSIPVSVIPIDNEAILIRYETPDGKIRDLTVSGLIQDLKSYINIMV